MEITAKLVNQLRERSGAPLMDCKRALVAVAASASNEAQLLDAAFDNLRKQGLKSADKRAGRATAQGRVAVKISPDGTSGAVVGLGCETDFVAATDDFNRLLNALAEHVLAHHPDTVEALGAQKLAGSQATIGDALKEFVSKSGENTQVTTFTRLEVARGRVGGYVHHNQKVAALIALSTEAPADKVDPLLKQLGMHIASAKPVALSRDQVPAEVVEREKAVYRESEDLKGKPTDKVEMIMRGKLEKFYQGIALLEQPWVLDDKQSVKQAIERALGPGAKIERFALALIGA